MRTLLLAGTSLLAITAAAGSAEATTIDYTSSLQTYTVPETGTYSIEAFGAGGGTETYKILPNVKGGKGADVAGDFALTQGEVLSILVGGRGDDGPRSSPNTVALAAVGAHSWSGQAARVRPC